MVCLFIYLFTETRYRRVSVTVAFNNTIGHCLYFFTSSVVTYSVGGFRAGHRQQPPNTHTRTKDELAGMMFSIDHARMGHESSFRRTDNNIDRKMARDDATVTLCVSAQIYSLLCLCPSSGPVRDTPTRARFSWRPRRENRPRKKKERSPRPLLCRRYAAPIKANTTACHNSDVIKM